MAEKSSKSSIYMKKTQMLKENPDLKNADTTAVDTETVMLNVIKKYKIYKTE